MALQLIVNVVLVASEEISCDGSRDFIDILYKNTNTAFRSKHLVVGYKCKFCKISKGERFKHYEFVDDEGELHVINCRFRLDEYMIKHRIYPEIILNSLPNES